MSNVIHVWTEDTAEGFAVGVILSVAALLIYLWGKHSAH